jgi:glucose/arabinose dehydrogenase
MAKRSSSARERRALTGAWTLASTLVALSCSLAGQRDDAPAGRRNQTPSAASGGSEPAQAGASGSGVGGGAPIAGSGGAGHAGEGGDGQSGTGFNSGGGAGTAPTAGNASAAGASGTGGSAAGTGGSAGNAGSGGAGGTDENGCPLVPPLRLARVVTLTASPMVLTQAAGDPRLFIAERPGRILIHAGDSLEETPFLDIRPNIAPEETERGLLSMALHPAFAENGRFYVVYTRAADDPLTPALTTVGDLVLAEGRVSSSDPDAADATLTVLLTVPKSVRYHNGGMIAFGKDGMLFMSVGEDGCAYSPTLSPLLQQRDNRLGKLLRIDIENPDTPPPGNFSDGDPYVWDYGFRNPWRMSFDRKTGDLYVGDLGEGSWEEINYEPFGQGQKNYGWPLAEGDHCSPNTPGCDLGSLTPPLHEFPHSGAGSVNGRCGYDDTTTPRECNRAVVGGYVYRGSALPELEGRYFYGDFINNTVSSLIVKDGAASCHAEHQPDLYSPETPIQGLVSFSEDAAGELYVLDLLGNVYRIERE